MTNTGGPTPAGWYTDPGGSGHLRWWDGTTWTAHLAPQPTPVAQAPVVQAAVVQTPVLQTPTFASVQAPAAVEERPYVPFQNSWNEASSYATAGEFARPAQWNTVGGWLLAFSTVIGAIGVLIHGLIFGFAALSPYVLGSYLGTGAVVFLVLVLCAEADRRKLKSLGYLKVPSLWWMLLLPPLIYLILRTVAVWGEARKGIAPLIVYLAVGVATGIASSLLVVLLLPGLLGAGSSTAFAASLQQGLDEKGGSYTVVCPPTIPQTIGAEFSCVATESTTHAVHTLSIEVVAGSDGKPTVKLLSVTPAIGG